MKFPFKEERKDDQIIRTFNENVNPLDLVWHKDDKDRVVTILENSEWKFQFEDELPIDLYEGRTININKTDWHRVIKGSGELKIKIIEFN